MQRVQHTEGWARTCLGNHHLQSQIFCCGRAICIGNRWTKWLPKHCALPYKILRLLSPPKEPGWMDINWLDDKSLCEYEMWLSSQKKCSWQKGSVHVNGWSKVFRNDIDLSTHTLTSPMSPEKAAGPIDSMWFPFALLQEAMYVLVKNRIVAGSCVEWLTIRRRSLECKE